MTDLNNVHVLITVPFAESQLKRLQAVSPRLILHLHPARTGDELPVELLPQIDVLYTLSALPEPDQVPHLAWVQFHLAGVDHAVDHPLLQKGIQVTTLSGAAVPQISESR